MMYNMSNNSIAIDLRNLLSLRVFFPLEAVDLDKIAIIQAYED
jgi:hypothetical protein